MKKHLSIKSTHYPLGWTGEPKKFNLWMRSLQRQIDKFASTDLAGRYKVN